MSERREQPKPDRQIADMDGDGALPRKNGELVFDETAEARVFGMAIAMHEQGRFAWDDFRDRLVDEIASAERDGIDSGYYERWLNALERLLVDRGLLSREELGARLAAFTSGQRDDVF